MKGFKHTGRGPKSGHSFSSKAGFTHSGTGKQNVKGYTRSAPKKKFAHGGMVTAPMASGDSSVIKRTKPVTGFDAEHGGKGPLRPGFSKGGKACYAEGGKVATTGAAIKMMKELMKRGNSAEDAAAKAARRYGVSTSSVKAPKGPSGGGGLPAEKQMLAMGGLPTKFGGRSTGIKGGRNLQGPPLGNPSPGKSPMALPPAPQGQKVPGAIAMAAQPAMSHHGSVSPVQTGGRLGYGSFGRRPLVR